MAFSAFYCFAALLLLVCVASGDDKSPCVARKSLDSLYDEEFSFENTWSHVESIGVSAKNGMDPMTGLWSFDLVFCDSLNAIMGDATVQPLPGLFGFSHGSRSRFEALAKTIRMTPIQKPSPTPITAVDDLVEDIAPTPENPHIHDNVKEFIMYYDGGDIGLPCSAANHVPLRFTSGALIKRRIAMASPELRTIPVPSLVTSLLATLSVVFSIIKPSGYVADFNFTS